jgi:hypothetical protein
LALLADRKESELEELRTQAKINLEKEQKIVE